MRTLGVKWSPEKACFVWDCIHGCHGWDYESGAEATRAFNTHPCVNDIERKA